MAILFIRFGWFILGAFFGAWVISDLDRSNFIFTKVNSLIIEFQDFIFDIISIIES